MTLIVLAWNQLPLTEACVQSLRDHTDVPYELIIVDNGSEPEAARWAEDHADTVVLNDGNLGFAPGMNGGLAKANGEFVAFINNDTVFPIGWASELLDGFHQIPNTGIILPAVTAAGNPTSVRTVPGDDLVVIPPFQALPSGVVYVMTREFAESLGGWDERYHVASREDLDLLFTTWALGRQVVLDERVLVWHESNATATAQLPDRDEIWMTNWRVFVDKWTGADPTSGHPDTNRDLVIASAAAAHWLDRWYMSFNEAQALERKIRQQERRISALVGQMSGSRSPSLRQQLRSATIVKRIGRRLGR